MFSSRDPYKTFICHCYPVDNISIYIYICIVCGFLLFSCTAKAKKHQEIVDWQAGEELMITVRDAQQNIPIRIHGRNICLHFPLNVAIFPLM